MEYKEVIEKLKDIVYKWDDIQLICDYIILWAVLSSSSDIHIEPLSTYVRLRYRIDGDLREILEYQNFLHQWIVARFKILLIGAAIGSLHNVILVITSLPALAKKSRTFLGKSLFLSLKIALLILFFILPKIPIYILCFY